MSKICFSSPAGRWKEALPIGNGKTAAMVYGGKKCEKLDFNDATLWSGYPRIHDNPAAKEVLPKVRKLIEAGEFKRADELVQAKMDGDYSQAYMPLGTVCIKMRGASGGDYKRTLDTEKGVLTVLSGNVTRTAFVSHPDGVAVYSIKSDFPIDVKLTASTPHKGGTGSMNGAFVLFGNAPDAALPNYLRGALFPIRYNEGKAMAFALACAVKSDGEVKVSARGVSVKSARFVHFYFLTHTGFKDYKSMPNNDVSAVSRECADMLNKKSLSYEDVYNRHISDFSAIMCRQQVQVADINSDAGEIYLSAKGGRADARAVQLLYDYGKYMIVSGSRTSQPLNLQGQWNNSRRPPWSSNLTTNINFEMNYLAASACGLYECLQPFYTAAREIAERGELTAAANFGMGGACCNHNVDIWRTTSPVKGDPQYMYSPLCGAWIACEAYRHAKVTGGDITDVVEKFARFILDYLTQSGGKLTIIPSVSPETRFGAGSGTSSVGIGSAFELSIARQTLAYCVECTRDNRLKDRAAAALAMLAPLERSQIGLSEWSGGKDSIEKGHRHFSPLIGVYPFECVARGDREFEWAHELFLYRLKNSTPGIGWSAAWAMCLAGRFFDKAAAERAFYGFTSKSLLPNFFGFHPPVYFQIDGNLGFVAGINETLVTCDRGVLTMLPALLGATPCGRARGLAAGGAVLDFEWENGEIIYLKASKPVRVRRENIAPRARLEGVEIV